MDSGPDSRWVRAVLGRSPHFRELPSETLDHMAKVSCVHRFIDKELLVGSHGKRGFSVVLSGGIQVSILSASGSAATIAVLGQGTFLGLNALFGSPIDNTKEFRSVGATALATIAPAALKRLADHDDSFRAHAVKLVGARLVTALGLLADVTHAPLQQRLARRLLGQALGAGNAEPGEVVEIRTSQMLLAEMLGASRTRVNEELGRLERAGIVQRRYRALGIIDVARLNEIAGTGVTPI